MFLFTYIVIQGIVTMEFIIIIAGWVNALPTTTLRYFGWRLITSRTTAFILDLIVSCIIGWFTGEGMTSGFANLTSGIAVSQISPYILNWKFKYKELESKYTADKRYRKSNDNAFTKARNKVKETWKTVFRRDSVKAA